MSRGLTVSSAVTLATVSLQSGVSKAREFNLSPVHVSKLTLKSAYVCLKVFMGTGEEVGKGVCQEVVLCRTHLLVWCFVLCYTTVIFSLAICPAAKQLTSLCCY